VASPAVLIVEDDRPTLTLLSRYAISAGYEPLSYTSGTDAVHTIVDRPRALIVDIGLAESIDGIEVADRLRRRFGYIPVLVVSGFAGMHRDHVVRMNALGNGVWLHEKPVSRPLVLSFLALVPVAELIGEETTNGLVVEVTEIATRLGLDELDRSLLALIARGMKRDEIARRLDVPTATIRSRIRRLLEAVPQDLQRSAAPDHAALRDLLLDKAKRHSNRLPAIGS
jgi:FixJ family two-component response regulator